MTINTQTMAAEGKLDAGFVLREMETEQQFAFVSGIVEGLAYARFLQDKPDETGMRCVSQWLHKDAAGRWKQIEMFFAKHHEKPPAALLYVLVKKECGA